VSVQGDATGARVSCLGLLAPAVARRRPVAYTVLGCAAVLAAYVLLVNRYWHFMPDSAVYLGLGRSLARGEGYVYNGVPHAKYPGGMGYLLGALLTVSRRFLWLNAVQCAILLGGLAALYVALRQLTDHAAAFTLMLLTATLFWVQEYATSLLSEAPFLLLSNAAVLMTLVFCRRRGSRLRAVLLAGIIGALAAAFWFRILSCLWAGPIGLALLFGDRGEDRFRGRLVNAAILGVAVLVMMGLYFAWTRRPRPPALPATPQRVAATPYALPKLQGAGAVTRRAMGAIRWPTDILCAPWEAGARLLLPDWLVSGVGALVFVVLMLGCCRLWREGAVLPAAWLAFLIPLAAFGPEYRPTLGRYAVPVAPFILISFLVGLRATGEFLRNRGVCLVTGRRLVTVGLAALLVPNLLLLAGDIYVARRADFYAVFRGGAYQRLFSINKWLYEREADGLAAGNLTTPAVVPAMTSLTTRRMPKTLQPGQTDFQERVRRFARENGTPYVVIRDSTQPWPVWHLPAGTFGRPRPTRPYWRLWEYRAEGDRLVEIDVPPVTDWPVRVPWPERE